MGQPQPSAESLRWCIGPPLKSSLLKLPGPRFEHVADDALVSYRERFSTIGLFENDVLPGIERTFGELQDCGCSLSVATSKPAVHAERIIQHFGLRRYFRSVDGSELDGARGDKTLLIAHILKRDGMEPGSVIMNRDREHDMLGAHQNGVTGLGVLWGHGLREQSKAASAYARAAAPSDLTTLVNKIRHKAEMTTPRKPSDSF